MSISPSHSPMFRPRGIYPPARGSSPPNDAIHQSFAFIVPASPKSIIGNSAGTPNIPIQAPAQSANPRSCDNPTP